MGIVVLDLQYPHSLASSCDSVQAVTHIAIYSGGVVRGAGHSSSQKCGFLCMTLLHRPGLRQHQLKAGITEVQAGVTGQ